MGRQRNQEQEAQGNELQQGSWENIRQEERAKGDQKRQEEREERQQIKQEKREEREEHQQIKQEKREEREEGKEKSSHE